MVRFGLVVFLTLLCFDATFADVHNAFHELEGAVDNYFGEFEEFVDLVADPNTALDGLRDLFYSADMADKADGIAAMQDELTMAYSDASHVPKIKTAMADRDHEAVFAEIRLWLGEKGQVLQEAVSPIAMMKKAITSGFLHAIHFKGICLFLLGHLNPVVAAIMYFILLLMVSFYLGKLMDFMMSKIPTFGSEEQYYQNINICDLCLPKVVGAMVNFGARNKHGYTTATFSYWCLGTFCTINIAAQANGVLFEKMGDIQMFEQQFGRSGTDLEGCMWYSETNPMNLLSPTGQSALHAQQQQQQQQQPQQPQYTAVVGQPGVQYDLLA